MPFSSTHSSESQQFHQQHRLWAQSDTVTKQCPGYRLALPINISPFACYAHLRCSLPWSLELSADGIILRSSSCKRSVGRSSAEPCSACSSIASHQIIAGILHRLTHETHENTKLEWLNVNDLHKLVHRKNIQINDLKLDKLNKTRTLAHCANSVDSYRRLVMAIASNNIARVNAILAVAMRNHASPEMMIERLTLAAKGIYKVKSYTELDFKLSYVLWRTGGQRAANTYACAHGDPHTSTIARHWLTPPLIPSHSAPTPSHMAQNLNILFPSESSYANNCADNLHWDIQSQSMRLLSNDASDGTQGIIW